MKRLGKLEDKAIIANEFAPNNDNVIWKDNTGDYKEAINGEWVHSPKFPQGGGGDEYEPVSQLFTVIGVGKTVSGITASDFASIELQENEIPKYILTNNGFFSEPVIHECASYPDIEDVVGTEPDRCICSPFYDEMMGNYNDNGVFIKYSDKYYFVIECEDTYVSRIFIWGTDTPVYKKVEE